MAAYRCVSNSTTCAIDPAIRTPPENRRADYHPSRPRNQHRRAAGWTSSNSGNRHLWERPSPFQMRKTNSQTPHSGPGTDAKPKGRPIPGSFFDDRMRHGPGCSRCRKLAPISSPSVPSPRLLTPRPQRAFFKASRNLSSDEGFCIPARIGAPPPASDSHPSSTAQREDCAILIVPMSSGRLFLGGLLASRARLRFTGTINLPCLSAWLHGTGHFYFALTAALRKN